MEQQQIEEIKARCDKATEGPWVREHKIASGLVKSKENGICNCALIPNADFIAHSREDIPELLTEVERLTTEIAKLREKQTPKMVDVSDDGEKFCPACNNEIAGYYAQYCEHCGQHLDYPEEE